MAEILSVLAAEILKQLGSMAVQEIGVVWGVKDQLQKLRDTVSTISAVLLTRRRGGPPNREAADWLEKLGDELYGADDLLDDFSTEVLRCQVMTQDKKPKKVRIFFSRFNHIAFRIKMGLQAEAIHQSLDAIADGRRKFHFAERAVDMRAAETGRRDETHSFVPTHEVIGRKEEKRALVKRLLDPNVGGNVGDRFSSWNWEIRKNPTRTIRISNDDELTKFFELELWVCVSDVFDVKSIAEKNH